MTVAARTSLLPLVACALGVLAVDLATKALAVRDPGLFGDGLIHNPELPSSLTRLTVCVATIAVVAAATRMANRGGAGPVPMLWVAAGLLVGGTVGNWIAGAVWAHGVPDFIDGGDRMWNLADFAIGLGMLLAIVSAFGYALRAYVRSVRARYAGDVR